MNLVEKYYPTGNIWLCPYFQTPDIQTPDIYQKCGKIDWRLVDVDQYYRLKSGKTGKVKKIIKFVNKLK